MGNGKVLKTERSGETCGKSWKNTCAKLERDIKKYVESGK